MMDKPSSRVGGIGLGILIFIIAFIVIPDPNVYSNVIPHRLILTYCDHSLLWVYYDQADDVCHHVHVSRSFMSDLKILAQYPVYGVILYIIPYTFPTIMGLLIVAALPNDFASKIGRISWRSKLVPMMVVTCFVVLAFLALVIPY